MSLRCEPGMCMKELNKACKPLEPPFVYEKGTATGIHDDTTRNIIESLRSVKAALEVVAGRPTPTSAALGKAISELCFQDADRKHKKTAIGEAYYRTAELREYGISTILHAELYADRRNR